MDAANMLKPALARGELRCIGATTLDEYRKHIEKDAALERRFQPVLVGEPTRGGHHRHPARPQGALRGAPRRAHPGRGAGGRGHALAPLHHRPLPAGQGHRPDRRGRRRGCASRSTRCRPRSTRSSAAIMQLEIEREALKKEKDAALAGAAGEAREGAGRPQGAVQRAEGALADGEGGHQRGCAGSRRSIEQAQPRSEQARARRATWTRPAELRYGDTARAGEAARQPSSEAGRAAEAAAALLKEEVDEEDIAEVVAKWTGIPVSRLLEGEVAEAAADGGAAGASAWSARTRPSTAVSQRRAPRARGLAGPEPADRLASSSWARPASARPSWPGAGRVPVRRRERDGPHRHVRVHGEAHRGRG